MSTAEEFAQIERVFGGAVPSIYQVMAKKGMLPIYWPMIKDAIADDQGIKDRRVREGLMVVLSTYCGNNYCFVAHSAILNGLGMSIEKIKNLVQSLDFPSDIPQHQKWSRLLQWAVFFGRPPGGRFGSPHDPSNFARRLVTDEEYTHLYKICSAVDLLNRFAEFHANEVSVKNEKMFQDAAGGLAIPIPALETFYTELIRSASESETPFVSMCTYCKKIKDPRGKWYALEIVLGALRRDARFSHAICPECERHVETEVLEPARMNGFSGI